MDSKLLESAWKRGWRDTKTAWTSWQFLLSDSIGGILGIVLGHILSGQWYIGILVSIMGFLGVWFGATAKAPIKQRNEARKYVYELEINRNIMLKLALVAWEGATLRNKFEILKREGNDNKTSWPVQNYNQWTAKGFGLLSNNGFIEDTALWVGDIDVIPTKAIIDDYIKALTNGINRFEVIIERLRNTASKEVLK